MNVPVKKLRPNAKLPTYGTEFSAGADLYACLYEAVTILPGESRPIPAGVAVEIPAGFVGLLFARSSLACKRGLAPANQVGVIDSDYRGELVAFLHNHGAVAQTVEPGERMAQLVIVPYLTAVFDEVSELSDTVRGTGGFGSTGRT